MSRTAAYDIVVPTVGRPSLVRLLESLDAELSAPGAGPAPGRVVVVDDRPDADRALELPPLRHLAVQIVRAGGAGPAASRNRGWRATDARWICFLDDDVEVRRDWSRDLAADLAGAAPAVGAVQGRVRVPLPTQRRPTDRERNVAGLEGAAWITADMAIRSTALASAGGFDERFPRAYREDADLALRLLDIGWELVRGRRRIDHPVGPAPWNVSIGAQRGNADDALMHRLHGAGWRRRAEAPPGAFGQHVRTTALGLAALGAAVTGHRRPAVALSAAWLTQWARFTGSRVLPGPRTGAELAAMAATSAAIPLAATFWSVVGRRRARRLAPRGRHDRWHVRRPRAVLFDRDGTLIEDVPYNGDPAQVRPLPGVREALDRLRAEGVLVGVVSNQSGVARGDLTARQVEAVNERLVELLGPLDTIRWCPHGPDDECACRKPAPGMVRRCAEDLGVPTTACALVGDIGSDVEAGLGAGARSLLVPDAATRAQEVAAAPEVARDLAQAVDALLRGYRLPAGSEAWSPTALARPGERVR